jgi:tetratricopeptide (TPR) repeat protein
VQAKPSLNRYLMLIYMSMNEQGKKRLFLIGAAVITSINVYCQNSLPAVNFTSSSKLEKPQPKNAADRTISRLYDEAVSLYAKKRYPESLSRFFRIKSIKPNYRQTSFYLATIPDKMENISQNKKVNKEQKKELSWQYKRAVRLYKKNLFEEALRAFYKIQEISPGYAKSIYYIKKINSMEQKQANSQASDTPENVADLYKKAVAFYRKKHYEEALVLFKKIEGMSPNFKQTSRYLQRVFERIKENIEANAKNQESLRKEKVRNFLATLEKNNN